MKSGYYRFLFTIMCGLGLLATSQAQFDDVYYDPDDWNVNYKDSYVSDYNAYDDSDYDNASYNYYDDYDYYYTSRIRRFHRPYVGFGFYDPIYVDRFYYDPFFDGYYAPGASIYISLGTFNDYYRWRRWSRWNRYYTPSYRYYAYNYYGYNSWYYPPGYAYNVWSPWRPRYTYWGPSVYINNYYGYGGGYGAYVGNYYNGYCPIPVSTYNGYGGTYVNNRPGNGNGVYYGPRGTGSVNTSPRARGTSVGDNAIAPRSPSPGDVRGNRETRPTGQSEGVTGTDARIPRAVTPDARGAEGDDSGKATYRPPATRDDARDNREDVVRPDRGRTYTPPARPSIRERDTRTDQGQSARPAPGTQDRPAARSSRPNTRPSAPRVRPNRNTRPSTPSMRSNRSSRPSTPSMQSSRSSRPSSPSTRSSSPSRPSMRSTSPRSSSSRSSSSSPRRK